MNIFNHQHRNWSARLICLFALALFAEVLVIITLAAGQLPRSLRGTAMLTFDTSTVQSDLLHLGFSPKGKVWDWYEPHYLSVCKGMWQLDSTAAAAATHVKNEASIVCDAVPAGYIFSLADILAADAGLPLVDNDNKPNIVFENWKFAVLHTQMGFVCIVLTMTFVNIALIDYFVSIFAIRKLTPSSPLHWPKAACVGSVLALFTMVLSSGSITAQSQGVLRSSLVITDGVAWSSGGFYALTWVATGLLLAVVVLSVVFAIMLRRTKTSRRLEAYRKG